MPIPALIVVGSASQVAPPLAALRLGRSLPVARRWIVAWSLWSLLIDAILLSYAVRGANNHFFGYLTAPGEVLTVLFALACWHSDPRIRRGLRLAGVGFIVLEVVLVGFVEQTDTFSILSSPLRSLTILAGCALTLVMLIRHVRGNLTDQDWFWICCGLGLQYGSAVAIDPMARLLMAEHVGVVFSAWKIKSVLQVVASLLIARGIWCPVLPQPSSGPTPSASSPSSSSSPPLARPW